MQFLVQMGGNILQAVFDDGALCAAFLVSTTRLQKSNGTGQSVCSCSQHGKTSIKHSLFSLTVSQFGYYFKIYKPKHEAPDLEDDYCEYEDGELEEIAEEPEDEDTPPWEEDTEE